MYRGIEPASMCLQSKSRFLFSFLLSNINDKKQFFGPEKSSNTVDIIIDWLHTGGHHADIRINTKKKKIQKWNNARQLIIIIISNRITETMPSTLPTTCGSTMIRHNINQYHT